MPLTDAQMLDMLKMSQNSERANTALYTMQDPVSFPNRWAGDQPTYQNPINRILAKLNSMSAPPPITLTEAQFAELKAAIVVAVQETTEQIFATKVGNAARIATEEALGKVHLVVVQPEEPEV